MMQENANLVAIQELLDDDENDKALNLLDQLLLTYAQAGDIDAMVDSLKQLSHAYPRNTALRERLVAIYLRRKNTDKATEQLDILGEQYLEAGQNQDAARIIKLIMQNQNKS